MTIGSSDFYRDQDLIAMICSRMSADREKAWDKIYRDNYPKIRALVKGFNGSLQDFLDIYHDSLLCLMRNIEEGKFRNDSSISIYLHSICYNQTCKKLKIDARKLLAEKGFEENLRTEGDYDHQRDILWARISLILATKLHEECRDILVKFYFEEQSMKQLQAYFNVSSEQAAKNKKMRCLNYLRRALEDTDINPEALKT